MSTRPIMAWVRDEEGMTLLELVIAAMILFIAITAVFSLIIAATGMSVFAKQENIVNNAAGSYMDFARLLPYDAIGVEGGANGSIVGSLTAETTAAVTGFTVTITPKVVYVQDETIPGTNDYKQLTVLVSSKAANAARSVSQSFVTYIRRQGLLGASAAFGGTGGGATQLPPTIAFNDAVTPVEDSIVWGTGIPIAADAAARTDGAVLDKVLFTVDGNDMLGGGMYPVPDLAGTAKWTQLNLQSGSFSCLWDTRTALDGHDTVNVSCMDSMGNPRFRIRRFMVDNSAPDTPTPGPEANVLTSTATLVTWAATRDGKDYVTNYAMHIWQDTNGMPLRTSWTDKGEWSVGTTGTTYATTAFSRYWAGVEAVSARGLRSPLVGIAIPFISKPSLAGTASVQWSGTNNLGKWVTKNTVRTTSAPTFPDVAASRSWSLYRATSASGPWTDPALATGTGTTMSYTDTLNSGTGKKNQTNPVSPAYYYKVKYVVQPMYDGYGVASPAETVWSNAVGPSPITETAGVTLATAGW